MDKLRFMRLWDIYRNMFTSARREMGDMYCDLDLTVTEIAAEKSVTRQAVSECLTGCKKQLEEYEEKLCVLSGLSAADARLAALAAEITEWSRVFFAEHPSLAADGERLKDIINKNCGADLRSAE